jgi:hypothetical protein
MGYSKNWLALMRDNAMPTESDPCDLEELTVQATEKLQRSVSLMREAADLNGRAARLAGGPGESQSSPLPYSLLAHIKQSLRNIVLSHKNRHEIGRLVKAALSLHDEAVRTKEEADRLWALVQSKRGPTDLHSIRTPPIDPGMLPPFSDRNRN